jgi:hypothetical protein
MSDLQASYGAQFRELVGRDIQLLRERDVMVAISDNEVIVSCHSRDQEKYQMTRGFCRYWY